MQEPGFAPSTLGRMSNSHFQRPEVIAAARRMKDAAAFFSTRGWLLGTCGNLSVKLSDSELLATPSGRDKSQLELEDFLVVDPSNAVLSGQPARASAELGVHRAIYAAKPAGAVYHVHSIHNNLASRRWKEQGHVRFEGVEMIKGLAGKNLHSIVNLPIVANSDDMEELSANVAAGISGEVDAVLVYQHGVYSWGKDADEARRHVEVLEFLLEYAVRAEALTGKAF